MKTKYRVIKDKGLFYAQFKKWWMPFYIGCFFSSLDSFGRSTLYEAIYVIEKHKENGKIVYVEVE